MPELTSFVQIVNPTSALKEVNQNTMDAPVGILRNAGNKQQSKPVTTLIAPFSDTSDSEQEGYNQAEYGQEYETEPEGSLNPEEARETLQHEHLIKSGYLNKKQERRKNWKRRWFVLRSTKLAYYKSEKVEYELLKILDMNDVHAVAEVKLKNKQNVFGIVTPKRTYYVQATSKKELDEWVEAINNVKKDVQEKEFLDDDTGSQADSEDMSGSKGKTSAVKRISTQKAKSPLSGSTSVLDNSHTMSPEKETAAIDIPPRPPFHSSEYNAEGGHSFASASSAGSIPNAASSPSSPVAGQFASERKDSSESTASSEDEDDDDEIVDEIDNGRIIHKGLVYKLDRYKKTWKKRSFVLKNDQLLYYKSKDPKPHMKINLADILDVIETDPISKSKQNCFKVITPKRTYICCVNNEESQVAWLAAFQVALSKIKEKQKETESS